MSPVICSTKFAIYPVSQCVALRIPRHTDLMPATINDVAETTGGSDIATRAGICVYDICVIVGWIIDRRATLLRIKLDREAVLQAKDAKTTGCTADRRSAIRIIVQYKRHALGSLRRIDVYIEQHVEVVT